MRFQVPQFIETEVKVVGPFTIQQFIWVALGVGLLLLLFRLLSGVLFFTIAVFVIAFFGSMAFVRIEGLPLIQYMSLAISYTFGPKRYLFKKEEKSDLDV